MSQEEAEELVEQVAAKLSEHFDAIQIMATWQENRSCQVCYRGAGNWYARQGMAHEFLENDKAQISAREISMVLPQPPEDEDGIRP